MKYGELESSTVEWKETLPKHGQLLKTVIAFCNRKGGKIVVGIANNGEVKGVPENKIQDWMEFLDKMIYESTSPPIIPLIYSQRLFEKSILMIKVSSGMNKPYYMKSEGLEKGTYIRVGRSTLRADADSIEELKWTSIGRSFDTMPVYHSRENEIEASKVEAFLKVKKGGKSSPITQEVLTSYHLVCEEHSKIYPTVSGLLLFGSKPQYHFSEAFIICSHFKGISGREVIATIDCTGTLFEQFDTAFDFIQSRLSKSFTIKNRRRSEETEIPIVAIREVLINAIVHRNYHISAPIKIALFDNRLEIFSPGDFPGPLNPDNLRKGLTYIRNGAICKVFREAGLIEKLGSGFITLFDSYEMQGLKEPQVVEGENFIKCILPRLSGPSSQEKDESKKILELFDLTPQITITDVMNGLHIPRATAGRWLSRLTKEGVINKVGIGKNSHYKLS